MATHKTKQGILVLVDIVNFTGQATKLGNMYTAQYTEYFQNKVSTIATKYEFLTVKALGDAVLLFGTDVDGLLEMMVDLFLRDKLEDLYGFISRFRMVAHSGFFQFKMENNLPIDLVSPEGIMVFRLEKQAQQWELVVTQTLYEGVKSQLTEKRLEAIRIELPEPLKGFDSQEWAPTVYKLRIIKEQEEATNLLEPRLNQLEKEVQAIPVFGNIYPAVPMEKNFINLTLVCDDERVLRRFHDCLTEKEKSRFFEGREDEGDNGNFSYKNIDVNTLYDKFPAAIIMGLPGAGKTTILRNLAFREFNQNKTKTEAQRQVILFVPCGTALLFNLWYKQYQGAEHSGVITIEDALDYLTWVFLLGRKEPKDSMPQELAEFLESAKRVKQAFNENRVLLLVDALDEAADTLYREKIKEVFMAIYTHHHSQNRLYLTSRPSESVHLAQDIKRYQIPLFRVLSLTMEQVRAVAKHVMEEDSDIYKSFDTAIWQEEVVVKMAATPLTALLVAAYFQVYEQFDHRYPMYDLLLKFILLKAWENIKMGSFAYRNLDLFFQEIKAPDFFDKNKETEILYDALASLCYNLFYDDEEGIVQRSVTEEILNRYFITFIQERMHYNYDEKAAQVEAAQWRERFFRDHLLMKSGANRFVFVHSTIMEFLAAYHIVEKSKKNPPSLPPMILKCTGAENFLELETIPIATGSDLTTGYEVLRQSANLLKEVSYPHRIYFLGVKCLAEVEWLLQKTFRTVRMKSMRKPIESIIDRNQDAVRWVYRYLKDTVLSLDKEQLKKMVGQFESILKLSMPTFLNSYMDYEKFEQGDSELKDLRTQLLLKLVQKEIINQWFETQRKKRVVEIHAPQFENIAQLDSTSSHPEDKNFSYYRKLIGKELLGFYGSPNMKHSNVVRACALTPDGRFVVSASEDKTLILWNVESGKEIRSFIGHTNGVSDCAISPDGKFVISASYDRTLKLWDVATGKEIRTFSGHKDIVLGCALTPDGKRLVYASGDKTLKLWDIKTGKELRSFNGHKESVRSCTVTPDGKWVVSASEDKTLKLWDVETGKEIRSFIGHKDGVNSCALTPDGKRVVSASNDRTLKLWDINSGKAILSFNSHQGSVWSCAITTDGKKMVSASSDNTLKLWDVETGEEIRSFSGHKSSVTSCSLTNDGKWLVSASDDHTLKRWNVETGNEVRPHAGHMFSVMGCVLTQDGKRMVSASEDGSLQLWDVQSGKEIRSFIGHTGAVYSCALTPDGKRMISASSDQSLKLWDTESGKEIRSFIGHKSFVVSCALTPDGKKVVSASGDKTLKLWDVESGKEIRSFSGHTDVVFSCALTSDGKQVVSASWDKTLKLWNLESGAEIQSFIGHKNFVLSCILTSDGRRLLSTSNNKTLKLWDLQSGNERRSFIGHTGVVYSCALNRNENRVVSVSDDRTLKIWDMRTGLCLKTLSLPWIPRSVYISPAYPTRVFTANMNGTITIFDFPELVEG